jgi:uncharacterized protein YcbX
MLIGTLEALRRYPVKSLRGEALESAEVTAGGVLGDRAQALFARNGARAGNAYRGKENDRLHLLAGAESALAVAAAAGAEIELRGGAQFFDCAPISLIVDAWLEELGAAVGYDVEWERFRPNFFVRAAAGVPLEPELVNAQLTLGEVRLQVRSPIERCVVVTYDPNGEPSDPRILRFLAQQRNAWMGIYCDVLEPGTARLGDALVLR